MRVVGRVRRIASVAAVCSLALVGCSTPSGEPAGSGKSSSATSPTSATSATSGQPSSATSPTTSSPRPSPPTPTTGPSTPEPSSSPHPSTATPKPTVPPLTDTSTMGPGDEGPAVKKLQQRLSALGYWLGTADGEYGDLTRQAVMALQKAAGISRDGVYGPDTRRALEAGTRPRARTTSGNAVEVNLSRQLLLVVQGGRITHIFNTSTGSGQSYMSRGTQHVAVTPTGRYSFFRTVDGEDRSPLGVLWRPRYFNGGIAVHGYSSVPPHPASHGCVRVSNPAMDMIWGTGLMPIGRTVLVS